MKKYLLPISLFGVLSYFSVIIYAPYIKPGYNQTRDIVSILMAKGEPERPAVVLVFALAYLSLLSIALWSVLKSRYKMTGFFLSIVGVFSLAQLFLPMDPWQGFRTNADKIHDWITVLIAVSIILALYYFIKSSKKNSAIISTAALILILLFALATGWEIITMNFQMFGLLEKIWIGTFLLWLVYFGYQLSNELETG